MGSDVSALPRSGAATVSRHATWVLVLTSLVVFMVFLDATIVNVAFATISRSLRTDAGRLAWVLNGYSLAFAAILIPAGRLADRYGRKRLFLVGVTGFAVFSGLCGVAPGAGVLIAGRVLQALFAALVVPTSLALLLPEFPPERRHVAVGTQASMGALAAAIGPTLGALIIEYGSWRWVFLVNVPIGLAVAAVGAALLREGRDPAASGIPDPLGAGLVAAIPALASYAIIEGPSRGWTDPLVLGGFVLAALLLPVFVWRCRTVRRPALDLALFRIRRYRLMIASGLLFGTAFYGLLLANVVFLQTVWRYSVLRAALAGAAAPLVVVIVSQLSTRLAARVGFRAVLLAGAICWAACCSALALFVHDNPEWTTRWLPISLLLGLAIGLALPVQLSAVAAALPPANFGLGSAVNASFRQLGAVLGVSLYVALVGTGNYHRVWWTFAAIGLASGAILLLPPVRRATAP